MSRISTAQRSVAWIGALFAVSIGLSLTGAMWWSGHATSHTADPVRDPATGLPTGKRQANLSPVISAGGSVVGLYSGASLRHAEPPQPSQASPQRREPLSTGASSNYWETLIDLVPIH
jgi:hypothetical protein